MPAQLWLGKSCGFLARAVVLLVLLSGCGRGEVEADDLERALLSALVEDACKRVRPVMLLGEIGGEQLMPADLRYPQKESELVDEGMMQDFERRNRSAVALQDIASESTDCRFTTQAELERREHEPGILPPPGSDFTDQELSPVEISFSRPGFSRDRSRAIVRWDWSTADFGMCQGTYRIYEKEDDEWQLRDEVEYLVC